MIYARTKLHAKVIKKINNFLINDDFISRHKSSPKDFTRKRVLTFKIMILLLMNNLKEPVQSELDCFFGRVQASDTDIHEVTSSSFTHARKKLKHSAFIELDKEQNKLFYKDIPYKKWNDFRLVSIDGSTLRLPYTEEIAGFFGIQHENNQGAPTIKARISEAFDPLNHMIIDAQIQAYKVSEHQILIEHTKMLEKGDLAILDRNYPAFWVYKLFQSRDVDFCIRVLSSGTKIIESFVKSAESERIISMGCPYTSEKKCIELGLDLEPIRLRLVKVELDNGNIEVLITSLTDTQLFPINIFKGLYHLRWPVEEDYKLLKCRSELENFSGKSVESIFQDFYAKIFTANFASILAWSTDKDIEDKTSNRKIKYKTNWSNVMGKMKNSGFLLFIRTNFKKILLKLYELFTVSPISYRPGRTFEREYTRCRRIYSTCYR